MSRLEPLSITGLGCLSGLGEDLAAHHRAMNGGRLPFQELRHLEGSPERFSNYPAAWIEPRELLVHRKWSPASAAAIHVARQAIDAAGWSPHDRKEAAIFAGTSRGSIAGWLEPWPGRRPFPLMAASNSLPSEPAAAVASELRIEGPWQVLSSGCCAGLDALGTAALWLRAGLASRALVVAVDLPLVTPMLEAYAATGILATKLPSGDSPRPFGMTPAEGAAALCLERTDRSDRPQLLDYRTVGEPTDPLGGSKHSPSLVRMISESIQAHGRPFVTVPHSSGTRAQSQSEPDALVEALGKGSHILPLKPWTGHTIGASGLLETVLFTSYLNLGSLPPPPPNYSLPDQLSFPSALPAPGSTATKLASAMGGKHSLVTLRTPT